MLRIRCNMSENISIAGTDESNSHLYEILKNCANFQSYEGLPIEEFNDVSTPTANPLNYCKMYSASGNISNSFASDDFFGDNILEETGRISLAYENLRTIPRRIAEKFSSYTKCLDLSYNNFRNLSFLTFFEELHTLILDRNSNLDLNTLPYLPNLKILWINNCDITNITDWVHQIRKQCPSLEHLSVMGNPGLRNVFYCIIAKDCLSEAVASATVPTDYRQYILHNMPDLKYLDDLPKEAHFQNVASSLNNASHRTSTASSVMKNSSSGSIGKITDSKVNGNYTKSASILNFKELFYLRRRKKSYQSSSTN